MFDDYKKEVLEFYKKKKEDGNLPINLIDLAPGKIRDEVILIYQERNNQHDSETLRAYFGVAEDKSGYSKILEQIDIDKYKPIQSFVNGITKSPNRKVVELLAWLISFEPRPYENWKPKIKNEEKEDRILSIFSKKKTRSITIATVLVAGATLVGVIIKPQKQCMYWTGERYQAVSCDIKIGNTPIIALDTFKVSNLKRITRPDTLTKYSLGKVWHIKIDRDSAEFYSSGGYYPLDHKKGLVLSSYYILNKYALSKYKTIK
jgi:hypothetical protein